MRPKKGGHIGPPLQKYPMDRQSSGEKLAEREGFEPSVEVSPHTRLAGEHLWPLGHLSGWASLCVTAGSGPCQANQFDLSPDRGEQMAEGVGFEPTPLSIFTLNFQHVNISIFSLTDGLLTIFLCIPEGQQGGGMEVGIPLG